MDYFDWEVGDVLVLHLQGPLTLGDGTKKFRALIHEKLEAGNKKLLLNMSEVYYLDSSGLGELVGAYTSAKRHAAALKLMKLAPRVRDLVLLTHLYHVFEVFEDEDSAVRSFAASS